MRREVLRAPTIFLLHEFLTAQECAAHIARAETLGFEVAALGGSNDPVIYKEYRDNDRVIMDDADLAHTLYLRARDHLVEEWMGWHLCGFNERWRYYRYVPGQRFNRHGDGSIRRDNGEESQFTFLVYLNDGVEGGSTNFYLTGGVVLRVQPRAGTALVFMHRHLHEGAEVLGGTKYVLRTDVMYGSRGGPAPFALTSGERD